MPLCDNQLLALEITRVGDSAPRDRAYSPTAKARPESQGNARRALTLVREIGERGREEGQGLEALAGDELRHAEDLSLGAFGFALDDRERGVSGPEIDPDREPRSFGGVHSSTSALATTERSPPPTWNGELESFHAPTSVPEYSAERSAAAHVPGQLERRRVRLLNRHRGALAFIAYALDLGVMGECLAAPFMHHARSGADLGVGKLGDVLLHEVDEAAVALEEREELERAVGRVRKRPVSQAVLVRGGFSASSGAGAALHRRLATLAAKRPSARMRKKQLIENQSRAKKGIGAMGPLSL